MRKESERRDSTINLRKTTKTRLFRVLSNYGATDKPVSFNDRLEAFLEVLETRYPELVKGD